MLVHLPFHISLFQTGTWDFPNLNLVKMYVLYVTAVFIEGIMPVNRYLCVCMCARVCAVIIEVDVDVTQHIQSLNIPRVKVSVVGNN